MVEFFAGRGNLTKCMKLSGIPTAALDIKYAPENNRKSNAMDLNSVSGFAPFGCKVLGPTTSLASPTILKA